MEQRKILIYMKKNIADILPFLATYEDLLIDKISNNLIIVKTDIFEEDVISGAREFAITELYQDLTAFIIPLQFDFSINDWEEVIEKLDSNIYTIESIIPEIILLKNQTLKNKLRNYYYTKFNSETIETIIGFINQNMNASKTAKHLYMHRNTLNYRLDNFIEKSEIDVRSFPGAMAIYLLFRR